MTVTLFQRGDVRRTDTRHPPLYPATLGRGRYSGVLFCRLRSQWLRQYLPHPAGRFRQRGAHQPLLLCAAAQFLGITPQDIIDYGLAVATHPLSKTDIKRAIDAIDNDPFSSAHPQWLAAIEQLLEMDVRVDGGKPGDRPRFTLIL